MNKITRGIIEQMALGHGASASVALEQGKSQVLLTGGANKLLLEGGKEQ